MSPRIIIAHGFSADSAQHWFPWISERYESHDVRVPSLPNPLTPQREPWVEAIAAELADADEHTVLIGHSLGSITALRALTAVNRPIGGLILVAGFLAPVPNLSVIDPFTADAIDPERVRALAPQRTVIASDNDSIVPPQLTRDLARALSATFITVPAGGHFLAREGFDTFPALVPLIDAVPAA